MEKAPRPEQELAEKELLALIKKIARLPQQKQKQALALTQKLNNPLVKSA